MYGTRFGKSIVHYQNEGGGKSCGYCSSSDTSYSNGMWATVLTVEDYQDLIDRGWRRSGQHCYKPIMTKTCCPMYTIRCLANEFRVSKSQKKILKRVHNFLAYGITTKDIKSALLKKTEVVHSIDIPHYKPEMKKDIEMPIMMEDKIASGDGQFVNDIQSHIEKTNEVVNQDKTKCDTVVSNPEKSRSGKSRQMKAKYLRIERKKQKLRNMGLSESDIEKRLLEKKKTVTIKTLEEFINQPLPENPAHKLEIKLVRSFPSCPGMDETFELYKNYQINVHNDHPRKITRQRFERFLVNSPLEIRLVLVRSTEFKRTFKDSAELFAKYQKAVHKESEDSCNAEAFHYFLGASPLEPKEFYGSYHQQYWLDGKMIAVGVIDILPKCVSSVYFLYDPDYIWLSLGTYGALREIEFVRKLSVQFPELKYYYMGFYIHTCVKMRYKAAFRPSWLLCPEAYTWHPIKSCLPKLDQSKYSRLNEDPTAKDTDSTPSASNIKVLYNRREMFYSSLLSRIMCSESQQEEVYEYASLVGTTCAKRMLLSL